MSEVEQGHGFVLALIDLYLDDLEARSSVAHWRNVRSQLKRIARSVPDFSPMSILRFRQSRLSEAEVGRRTVNAEVKALSTFLTWAATVSLIPRNPVGAIKTLPMRDVDFRKTRRAMTDVEVRRFLAASRQRDRLLKRKHPTTPLWLTLIETGLRWGECVILTADSVVGEEIHLNAKRGKTRRRAIPIRPAFARALHRIAKRGGLLFRTPEFGSSWLNNHASCLDIFYATLKHAGIPRLDSMGRSIDIHSLRYTAISMLQRKGVPESIAQRVVGHSSKIMTRIYTDLGPADVRSVLKKTAWRA